MSLPNMSEISDTRSLILNAAIELFVDHNYDAVSVRQIAQAANCHLGSISYHFGGKEKLYEACFDSLDFSEFFKCLSLLDEAESNLEFSSKLEGFIYDAGLFALKNRKVLCLYFKETYSQTPRIKDIRSRVQEPALKHISLYFQKAKDKGIVREDLNVSFLVRTLLTIIQTEFVFKPSSIHELKIISKEFINLCNRSIYVS